jgi:tetratricopeptide (TPR) repeat protein
MRLLPLTVALLVALGTAGPAAADRLGSARQHFQSATSHFAVGEFAEAAEDYQAAYKLKPDPALLYNAAQSYRLAGKNERALILYRNYLQLYPKEDNIAEVKEQITKLKEAIAAAEKAKNAPPVSTAEPKPLPAEPPHPEPAPATHPVAAQLAPANTTTVAPAIVEREAPPQSATPIYKKWWLWTIVGVVVVGGAVTAAVLLTRPTSVWANAPSVGPGVGHALVSW